MSSFDSDFQTHAREVAAIAPLRRTGLNLALLSYSPKSGQ